MKVERVNFVYFSPNGTVKKTVEKMAGYFDVPAEFYDLTPFKDRWQELEFGKNELVVFAMPTYGGRIPIKREFFANITGNDTPCVALVLFGNRAIDDALLELSNEAADRGFKTVAAAAFLGEHSLRPKLAAGRPSEEDFQKLEAFVKSVTEKLNAADDISGVAAPQISGNFPYKAKLMDMPFAPVPVDGCTNCGGCAKECPVGAINPDDCSDTDKSRCILCNHCVILCPAKARKFDVEMFNNKLDMMQFMNFEPKQPEVFL